MIASYAIASSAVFVVLAAWVAIDHWATTHGATLPEGCELEQNLDACHACGLENACRHQTPAD